MKLHSPAPKAGAAPGRSDAALRGTGFKFRWIWESFRVLDVHVCVSLCVCVHVGMLVALMCVF